MILQILAQEPDLTRTETAKRLEQKLPNLRPHTYHYVFLELDQCLIPNGIVRESGHRMIDRGPVILRQTGIPVYRLTENGLLVAASLEEIDDVHRKDLVERYLITKAAADSMTFSVYQEMIQRLRREPESCLSLVGEVVDEFLVGKINQLEDKLKDMMVGRR